ncbi:MAG TPA: tetratricopeptide repeat protein [Micropepsaceae bacterium]|nr:tetratricopeptide repeat protein [Micropepsaceae bacterium]
MTSRPLGAPTNIDGTVKQAQAQRKSGDFSAAARTLSQLVLFAPDDARVLGEYGKTLIAMGRSEDALAFLERAVELQPRDWSLFSAQGVAYDQKGEYLAAQAAYGRALVLKPGEPTVLSNAALSHVQTGDLDGAEALLMQASPHGAEFPRIASNLALVRSLKNSRPPQAATVAVPKELAPVPAPTEGEAPSVPDTPDTPVASLPMPEPAASDIPMAPEAASVAETPADSAGDPATTATALERLQTDPSVLVQPLPSRPEAEAKPKPTGVPSGLPRAAVKSEPVLQMRPTPDDDKPNVIRPKPGNAKSAGSKAADNATQASQPLVLRPAVADPPATLQASARH